jgi:protein-S-isoprenylcysteine O-methyltransferase Ste14
VKIGIQATVATLFSFSLFGVAVFWPAGTFNYWQAWVFLAVYAVLAVVATVYFGVNNPDVLRRRMRAGPTVETRPIQKIFITGVFVTFYALLAFSALDHRHGWSTVPAAASLAGDVLVLLGLGIAMVVVAQNNYAAASITVETGQKLVSTGLYGIVRHPMYFGSLIMIAGIPLALGSYWGLAFLIPAVFGLVIRILDEEKALAQDLTGYSDYLHQVRYRLVPRVW